MDPSWADFSSMVEQQCWGSSLMAISHRQGCLLDLTPTLLPWILSLGKRFCVQLSGTNYSHLMEQHQTLRRLISLSYFSFSPTFADYLLLAQGGIQSHLRVTTLLKQILPVWSSSAMSCMATSLALALTRPLSPHYGKKLVLLWLLLGWIKRKSINWKKKSVARKIILTFWLNGFKVKKKSNLIWRNCVDLRAQHSVVLKRYVKPN